MSPDSQPDDGKRRKHQAEQRRKEKQQTHENASIQLVGMLAAVCRIGDEALHLGVNNQIEKFQGHLSYEHRATVADIILSNSGGKTQRKGNLFPFGFLSPSTAGPPQASI